MRSKELVQPIIGARGFVLEEITRHAEMNEIILSLRPRNGSSVGAEFAIAKQNRMTKGMEGSTGGVWT